MKSEFRCILAQFLILIICLKGKAQEEYNVSTAWFVSANGTDTLGYNAFTPNEAAHPGWGVVYLHGGGFFSGSRNGTADRAYCTELAKAGIPVMSMDYRLRQVGKGFHCDISVISKREAIRWAAEDLIAAIDAFGANFPEGIIAAGSSAGAEAVLDALFALRLSSLDGAISLSGGVEPSKTWRNTPILAVHGTCDSLVPYCTDIHHYCPEESPGALILAGAGGMAAAGAQVELWAIENAGHEISTTMLGEPFFIERSIDFINAVVTNTFKPKSNIISINLPCGLPQDSILTCQ